MAYYNNDNVLTQKPLSVKELCERTSDTLSKLGTLLVAGEVSGLKVSTGGHYFFSLKDDENMFPCVVWKYSAKIMEGIKVGTQVLAEGDIRYAGKYGTMTFTIRSLSPTGAGKLIAEQEARKKRYQMLGWFNSDIKKPLPKYIRHIGVVTSPTGAVIHDLLDVLGRRAPNISVTIFPCPVQGTGSEAVIASRIRQADAYGGLDCIIVMRGGGSIEDLAPFSTDEVVQAIHQANTPIISAVGHENDISLSDLVADVSAGTPSIAGEMISQEHVRRRDTYQVLVSSLDTHMNMRLTMARSRFKGSAGIDGLLSVKVSQAKLRLANASHLEDRLRKGVDTTTYTLARLSDDIHTNIVRRMDSARARIQTTVHPAHILMEGRLQNARVRTAGAGQELDALNPLSILTRGYSMVTDGNGRVLTDPTMVKPGDKINITTGGGKIGAVVENIE